MKDQVPQLMGAGEPATALVSENALVDEDLSFFDVRGPKYVFAKMRKVGVAEADTQRPLDPLLDGDGERYLVKPKLAAATLQKSPRSLVDLSPSPAGFEDPGCE